MNELYLQDYILKQISQQYLYSYRIDPPSDQIHLLFGKLVKDSLPKDIPKIENLFKFLIKESLISKDHSICDSILPIRSEEELCLPDEYVDWGVCIFGALKSLYLNEDVTSIVFEKACENLKNLSKDNSLIINKISPLKAPRSKRNLVSGASVEYEYGDSFGSLNEYYLSGKYNLECLTKKDIQQLLRIIKEIEDGALINKKESQILSGYSNKSSQLDCLTYLKRNDAIIDFKTQNQIALPKIEVHTNPPGLEAFKSKLFETTRGRSLLPRKPIEPQANKKYEIKYGFGGEITLNGKLIHKTDFDSLNDRIFGYLIKHPNINITRAELKKECKFKSSGPLSKIVERLKFTGALRQAFFRISKDTINFRNPIYQKDLNELKIPALEVLPH